MKNVRIGYARVSTEDQNLDMQVRALEAAGCDPIFTDKMTGRSMKRPGLANAFRHAVSGDTIVVWKLDRLGRSLSGIIEIVDLMRARGIEFKSLNDDIDTSKAMGRAFFHIIAALAELESGLISERTKAGLDAKKAREGWVPGRPKKMTPARIERYYQLKERVPRLTFTQIVADLSQERYGGQIAANTVRNWLREEKDAKRAPEEFDDK